MKKLFLFLTTIFVFKTIEATPYDYPPPPMSIEEMLRILREREMQQEYEQLRRLFRPQEGPVIAGQYSQEDLRQMREEQKVRKFLGITHQPD